MREHDRCAIEIVALGLGMHIDAAGQRCRLLNKLNGSLSLLFDGILLFNCDGCCDIDFGLLGFTADIDGLLNHWRDFHVNSIR
jgi:hypothetical protein